MKITDSENIKNGETELIDALTGDIDWSAIETILREKHKLGLQEDVEYKSGDMVVYKDKIAYKLDFDVKVTLSVLFSRDGECLSLSTSADIDSENIIESGKSEVQPEDTQSKADDGSIEGMIEKELDSINKNEETDQNEPDEIEKLFESVTEDSFDELESNDDAKQPDKEDVSQMASQIAEMISEINKL